MSTLVVGKPVAELGVQPEEPCTQLHLFVKLTSSKVRSSRASILLRRYPTPPIYIYIYKETRERRRKKTKKDAVRKKNKTMMHSFQNVGQEDVSLALDCEDKFDLA